MIIEFLSGVFLGLGAGAFLAIRWLLQRDEARRELAEAEKQHHARELGMRLALDEAVRKAHPTVRPNGRILLARVGRG